MEFLLGSQWAHSAVAEFACLSASPGHMNLCEASTSHVTDPRLYAALAPSHRTLGPPYLPSRRPGLCVLRLASWLSESARAAVCCDEHCDSALHCYALRWLASASVAIQDPPERRGWVLAPTHFASPQIPHIMVVLIMHSMYYLITLITLRFLVHSIMCAMSQGSKTLYGIRHFGFIPGNPTQGLFMDYFV